MLRINAGENRQWIKCSFLEKLYAFARHLNRKLPRQDNRLPYEIRDAVDLDSFRIEESYKGSISLIEKDTTIPGMGDGAGTAAEDEQDAIRSPVPCKTTRPPQPSF